MKPIVAIIGRTNTGKSTLFNRLAGRRISIVEDSPGVTRDRVYADITWNGKELTLIDTAGLEPKMEGSILSEMKKQVDIAISVADSIVFVCDVRVGVTADDEAIASMLKKSRKPIILCVNKVDNLGDKPMEFYEFFNLGIGEPMAVSSVHGSGTGDLLDAVLDSVKFDDLTDENDEDEAIRIAIVGKPNAGKSSLVNKILNENRMIVSEVAGTTRDSVDNYFERDGQKYIFVDTAGIRRKSKIKGNIERYSIIRAVSAISRADVCVLMIDAEEGVSEQDSKIAGIAHEHGKASVIAVNKWDLIEKDDKTMNKFLRDIEDELGFMPYAPKLFISAKTGQRVNKLYELIHMAYQNHCMRIATGVLNDVLTEAMAVNQPPVDKGRQLKIFYGTQVSVKPPTFVLFVNDSELMHYSYKRYIENRLRESFGLAGTPVRFLIRNRGER